jgi:hypothetical protein
MATKAVPIAAALAPSTGPPEVAMPGKNIHRINNTIRTSCRSTHGGWPNFASCYRGRLQQLYIESLRNAEDELQSWEIAKAFPVIAQQVRDERNVQSSLIKIHPLLVSTSRANLSRTMTIIVASVCYHNDLKEQEV